MNRKEGVDVRSINFRSLDLVLCYSDKHLSGSINIKSQKHWYKKNKMSWVNIISTHTSMVVGRDVIDFSIIPRSHCITQYFEKNPDSFLIVESKVGGSISYDNIKSINGKTNGVQYTPLNQFLIDYDSKGKTILYHCTSHFNEPLSPLEKAVFTTVLLKCDQAKYSMTTELIASAIEELRPLSEMIEKFKFWINVDKKLYCTQYNILLLQAANRLSSQIVDKHGIPNMFSGQVKGIWKDIDLRFKDPVRITCFPTKANEITSDVIEAYKDRDIINIIKDLPSTLLHF